MDRSKWRPYIIGFLIGIVVSYVCVTGYNILTSKLFSHIYNQDDFFKKYQAGYNTNSQDFNELMELLEEASKDSKE